MPLVQASSTYLCVVPRKTPLAESISYYWASEYGSRHPVKAGTEARYGEIFGPGTGGSVCNSSDIALSPLVISDSCSSAGAGCHGT